MTGPSGLDAARTSADRRTVVGGSDGRDGRGIAPSTGSQGQEMANDRGLTIGFPRMYNEPGERRAFLPSLVGQLADMDTDVYVEAGSGVGMGYADDRYLAASPRVHIVDEATAYRQDIVVVLRAPEGRYELIRPGAILISMLHFMTRPARVELLHALGIEAIALDMVTGDDGRRLVQNLRDVARNGLATAFDALERRWPPFASPDRDPISVTVLGAGGVGKHAIEWAAKCGDDDRNARFMRDGVPGVEVVVVEQNLSGDEAYFRRRLGLTDILVDATARRDTSRPLFPNGWLGFLPAHAVICDLAVDPYLLDATPRIVRGLEGIPQGDLDQWEFDTDDPAWDRLPPGIPTAQRRTVVSCYSWPGVRPEPCMEAYGSQVTPLLKTLIWYGGLRAIGPGISFHGRALWRGSLRRWLGEDPAG
jgi:alanine dehydrogenase